PSKLRRPSSATLFPYTTLFRSLTLAVAALVYGSLLAFRAPDFRGVVAYSSLAQSGLIALGLFSGTNLGFDGAVLQMVAHGLVSTDRKSTRLNSRHVAIS